jgi:dienelactone hydrolase
VLRFAAIMPSLLASVVWISLLAAQSGAVQPPVAADQASGLREAFLKTIDRPRVPLEAATRRRTEAGEYVTEEFSFAAEAGERVPALLVEARGLQSRQPVVIVLHGTGGSKEGMTSRLRDLAARGFVAVAIDGRFHGARATASAEGLPPYQAAMLRAYRTPGQHPFLFDTVWDVMRLIDYLETRADVDPRRIGLTGISKGGMETYLAAAADPRIAVAVPMIGVQSFAWALDHGAWDSRAWTLREALVAAAEDAHAGIDAAFMRKFYDRVAPGVRDRFDGPAMLPLIAPRPLLVVNGDSDPRTPVAGVRQCIAAAAREYEARGVRDRLVLQLQPDTGHQVTADGDRAALAWFERWLKPRTN